MPLVTYTPSQIMTTQMSNWADEFPKSVSRILTQGSSVTTMDFHPFQQTLLLGPVFYFYFCHTMGLHAIKLKLLFFLSSGDYYWRNMLVGSEF